MQVEQRSQAILVGLHEARVEFVVVGGVAGVLQGAPILTEDLDIVHRRTSENRRLRPKEDALVGHGHLDLMTDLGILDVLCELGQGEGYEEILADTVALEHGGFPLRVLGLPRLIAVQGRTGRPKDRAVLPVLIATLDEQKKREPH